VTPITTATNTPGPPIKVGSTPWALAITPDGQTAYVAVRESGTVVLIATATNTPGEPIKVGGAPYAIAMTP
jgi:YVTN family beta-propeller protein